MTKSIAPAVRLLALSALLGGCALLPIHDPFGGVRRPIRVDVANHNFNDANVWAVSRQGRLRLGTVTGKSDGSFRLPWKGPEVVHMEIDLIGGGGRCITEELTVDDGDVLYLEIELEFSDMDECRSG